MKTAFLILILIAPLNGPTQPVQDNTVVVKNIIDAFNRHDWQKMLSYYAAGAIFYDPAFESPTQDKALIAGHYQKIQDYIPDVHDTIRSIHAFGDTVVVEFISSGTSIEGKPFALPACTVFTFRNGLVIRDATYYDTANT